MFLNSIQPAEGAKHSSKRVGRGIGSGLGKTCGRGHKGQKSRAGGFHKVGFEGGQMPLYRRLPKRGFYNKFGKEYAEVNVSTLNCFEEGTVVDPVALIAAGILKNVRDGVRILGNGQLDKSLTVIANGFTKSAADKITAAGGKVEVI